MSNRRNKPKPKPKPKLVKDKPVSKGELLNPADPMDDGNDGNGKRRVLIATQEFTGPYPPPSILAEYKNIDPKLVDLIFQRAETEQSHRHKMESLHAEQFKRVVTQGFYGQCFAFVIAMTAIVGGAILINNGHSGTGIASILSAMAILAGVFITGKILDANSDNDSSDNDSSGNDSSG